MSGPIIFASLTSHGILTRWGFEGTRVSACYSDEHTPNVPQSTLVPHMVFFPLPWGDGPKIKNTNKIARLLWSQACWLQQAWDVRGLSISKTEKDRWKKNSPTPALAGNPETNGRRGLRRRKTAFRIFVCESNRKSHFYSLFELHIHVCGGHRKCPAPLLSPCFFLLLFYVLVKEADCCPSLSLNSGPLWGHSWTCAKSTLQTRPHSPAPFYPSEMSGLVRYHEFIGQATADCAFNFHIPRVSSFHLSSSTVRQIFPLTRSPFFPPSISSPFCCFRPPLADFVLFPRALPICRKGW